MTNELEQSSDMVCKHGISGIGYEQPLSTASPEQSPLSARSSSSGKSEVYSIIGRTSKFENDWRRSFDEAGTDDDDYSSSTQRVGMKLDFSPLRQNKSACSDDEIENLEMAHTSTIPKDPGVDRTDVACQMSSLHVGRMSSKSMDTNDTLRCRNTPQVNSSFMEALSRCDSGPPFNTTNNGNHCEAHQERVFNQQMFSSLGDLGTPVVKLGSPADIDSTDIDTVHEQHRHGSDFFPSSIKGNSSSLSSSSPFTEDVVYIHNELSMDSNDDSKSNSGLKSVASSSSNSSQRPLPDQSAFDTSKNSRASNQYPPSSSPVCPPTPVRTPTWAYESDRAQSQRPKGLGSNPSERENSLHSSKLLLSQTEESSTESCDVNFERDFNNEGLLGSGQFADVFRVREKATGQVFAVKKSKRQFRSKKDRDWLLNEVRTMKILGTEPCSNVLQLVRAWQDNGFFFVQIDLAERGTLKDLLCSITMRKASVPDSTIWRIAHDVATGLRHIHQCGMVHLDIKPANILIAEDGIIKIGDFGLTTLQGTGDDCHEGDTRYMAPELLASTERQSPADIFSFALTLYETCQVPSLSVLPSEGGQWQDMRRGKAPSVVGRDRLLTNLITLAMAPEPERRPTAGDILTIPIVQNSVCDGPDPTLRAFDAKLLLQQPLLRSSSFQPIKLDANVVRVNSPLDRVLTPTGDGGFWQLGK
jgi:hypothetical protein